MSVYSKFVHGWLMETSKVLHRASEFSGVIFSHLKLAERLVDIFIIVFEQEHTDTMPTIVWNSGRPGENKLYAILHGDHFCYIKTFRLAADRSAASSAKKCLSD